MRILQLVQKPQRRGAEIFSAQLSSALRELGHRVDSLYLYEHNGETSLVLGARDRALGAREDHPLETTMGFQPQVLRDVRNHIRDGRYDIVQVNGARTVKYGALSKRSMPRASWTLVYRNIDNPTYWVRGFARRWFYRRLVMPTVDGTVGVSRSTLDEVVRLYGDNGPSVAIPNGVDAEALKAIEPRECTRRSVDTAADAPVVVFLGHLGQQKRPDRFLRVMERVKRQIPEVRGWVLGDGPMHDELIEQARDLDLSETIHFVGYQSEVARFIHAADVLLVTSDSDGIPAVVLESALLGRPAVATDVGGMRECVRHGETGYLESPDEEEELAARVVELLRDAELRDRFGEKAREWAMDAFVMTRIAERYLDFYNRARKMPSIDAQ